MERSPPSLSGLNTPNGIAMNSLGEFYVADNVGGRIYRIAADGSAHRHDHQ
jgi:sugar lactone lactonase YvrE